MNAYFAAVLVMKAFLNYTLNPILLLFRKRPLLDHLRKSRAFKRGLVLISGPMWP